ncbi:MAG: helix-turn-helix domain-containing protein [Bacteroidales bacterium]|nr:helix-turn-helix domain-containing protein [Bacteroidales bacterium]
MNRTTPATTSLRVFIPVLLFLLCTFATTRTAAQAQCPVVRIVPEQLPSLNSPRSGHCIFYAHGELTVAGGHTMGFVPVKTAEYLSDGAWHTMTMTYTHDNGFAFCHNGTDILLGGGHSEELGVGHSYTLERYDPTTHSFEGFGCLDRRRVLSNTARLADGRIVISGNHYAPDAIACYDGRAQVVKVEDVRQSRNNPYILPIAEDNALIIGQNDPYQRCHDTIWADRLQGDAFRVPLLEQWRPIYTDQPFNTGACAIGDTGKGEYAYLLAGLDKSGQMALILLRDTVFSLLPTACDIPMTSPCGPVLYRGPIVVDKARERGYIVGVDSLCRRQFVLAIDYGLKPAALTLYHTDTLEHATMVTPILSPEGDLILAGGNPDNNFKPLSSVWLYRFGSAGKQSAAEHVASAGKRPVWLWILLPAGLLAVVAVYMISKRRRTKPATTGEDLTESGKQIQDEELMQRLCEAIEHERLFIRQHLRLTDIAVDLGVSTTTLSNCISRQRHCTFTQLITEYRVRHAQQLLRQNPEMKIYSIYNESGFTSESTFFRCFKSVTGLSPKEWVANNAPNKAAPTP